MSYLSSLAEHPEDNLEQSGFSVSIYCMGDRGQGDNVHESMHGRGITEAGKLTAYLMYYQSESLITWLVVINMYSSSVHLSS